MNCFERREVDPHGDEGVHHPPTYSSFCPWKIPPLTNPSKQSDGHNKGMEQRGICHYKTSYGDGVSDATENSGVFSHSKSASCHQQRHVGSKALL